MALNILLDGQGQAGDGKGSFNLLPYFYSLTDVHLGDFLTYPMQHMEHGLHSLLVPHQRGGVWRYYINRRVPFLNQFSMDVIQIPSVASRTAPGY